MIRQPLTSGGGCSSTGNIDVGIIMTISTRLHATGAVFGKWWLCWLHLVVESVDIKSIFAGRSNFDNTGFETETPLDRISLVMK